MNQELARAFCSWGDRERYPSGASHSPPKAIRGVRGIVCGDNVRRLVAKTIAQQSSEVVQSATAPFQYALSTKAGPECIAHERAPALSIDGIGTFDPISRVSMLDGLRSIEGGVRSFRLCCSSTVTHLLISGRTMRAPSTRFVKEKRSPDAHALRSGSAPSPLCSPVEAPWGRASSRFP